MPIAKQTIKFARETKSFSCPYEKPYPVQHGRQRQRTGTGRTFTHVEHRTGANRNRNRSGFSSLNPNPHFCYLLLSSLSVLVLTLTCTYLFPLWSEYLFTLRQRIICKQMNYPIWFSCRGKSYPDRWKQK